MNPLYGYSPLFSPYGLYAALGATATGNVSVTPNLAVNSPADAYQAEISAYGQLLSALSNFQYALAHVSPPYYAGDLGVSSSNSAVATASAYAGAQSATYNLTVSQLAQAQTVQSTTVSSATGTVIGSGTLTIQTGSYQSSGNTFTSDGSSPVTIAVSNGTLSSIASAINGSGAGVVASVQAVSGGYSLAIARSTTGAQSNFMITVSGDSSGSDTDMNGLSQLAFDPTATSGAGKNMTQAQAGADAAYTLNGVGSSAAGNAGVPIAGAVNATLLQTGSTVLTVGVDYAKLSQTAQDLIDAFNTLQTRVNALTNSGAALQDDIITGQLSTALNQQVLSNMANGASTLTTLFQVGVQFQAPQNPNQIGSLLLNGTSLQYAYALDQGGTSSLLSLSAQSLLNLSKAYSSAGYGIYPASINQLQQLLSSERTHVQYTHPNTFNLATLLALESQGTSNQSTALTAQQITALSQYATIMALGQPYALQAMLVGSIGGSSGFSTTA